MYAQHKKVGRRYRGAFTLIELLIVVAILGMLAAIVIPKIALADEDAKKTAFINNMRIFNNAAYVYMNITGQYLENAASGVVPTGWEPYIDESKWTHTTPIGGLWDVDQGTFGVASAFGVDFTAANNPGDEYMLDIDRQMDDGDLSTGRFRKFDADYFYFILEE